jgi:hypothetical protein
MLVPLQQAPESTGTGAAISSHVCLVALLGFSAWLACSQLTPTPAAGTALGSGLGMAEQRIMPYGDVMANATSKTYAGRRAHVYSASPLQHAAKGLVHVSVDSISSYFKVQLQVRQTCE